MRLSITSADTDRGTVAIGRRLEATLAVSLALTVFGASPPAAARQDPGPPTFIDATQQGGIDFFHENGATPDKYLPETMGAGGLIFDYDNDGWGDVFLVNGGSFTDSSVAATAAHKLYHNDGDGTFTEVSHAIGVSGYGMGACAADYDNDGWVDLYVTTVDANQLYRNVGGSGFIDVTSPAGVESVAWSSSCAFGDIDNDGNVDLYVANYLDASTDRVCYESVEERVRTYCHPDLYDGVSDVLYRNNGDGTFTDITREAGVWTTAGKGLGVVFSDYDADGWIDIHVANDSVPNFLFRNLGDGVFEESALWAGVAVGFNGAPQAGMGTDAGDVDGDGFFDIVVTNMDRETHNLYRNTGDGYFVERTLESGIGEATLPFFGFGAVLFDYDNDRDLDLAIGNGDVQHNVAMFRDYTSYAQRNLLLSNNGLGEFTDVGPASGPGFALEKVSRGMVVGDLDNDGDLDMLVVNNGQAADLLRNDGGNRNNALLVRTVGTRSNRDGIGARLSLTVDDQVQVREVKAGSSYLGQNDLRVHFGLGDATSAQSLEIRWPSGAVDRLEAIDANQILTVREGEGVLSRVPLER